MGILAFIYMLVISIRFYRRARRARAIPLVTAMVCFFFGTVYDTGVAVGLIQSIYLLEYCYMGMVILMAARLTKELGDITQTRALLHELDIRFNAFFHNTAVGLALTDCDGIITQANPGMCQMLGRSADTLTGRHIFEHFHTSDRPTLQRMVQSIVAGRGTTFRAEKRYTWPDGSVYWGDISISTVEGDGDKPHLEGLIWIIVGITERRHAVDSMRSLNEQLEDKVQQRTRTLIAINRRLEESLQKLRDDEEAGKAIQTSLLPAAIEQIGPLVFARHLKPSFYMSGDFVDNFRIDERHVGFYMADVSGHGISSAFVTVLLKSYMSYARERFRSREDRMVLDPGVLLKRLNAELLSQDVGKHLTLFYGVVDTQANTLVYANGGQFPFPILLREGAVEGIPIKGTPLGMFPFSEYENVQQTLPASFVMVFFSDGILELLEQPRLLEKQACLEDVVERSDGDIQRMAKRLDLDATAMPPDDVSILTMQKL